MSRKIAFLMLALTAALLVTGSDALAARIRCKPAPSCEGTQFADSLSGTQGADKIFGYGDNDELVGGDGVDDAVAAFFEEFFPEKDTIDCGPGNDTVKADRLDTVVNCEKVTRV